MEEHILQDATPLSLGQEFSGYHVQVKKSIERIEYALKEIFILHKVEQQLVLALIPKEF